MCPAFFVGLIKIFLQNGCLNPQSNESQLYLGYSFFFFFSFIVFCSQFRWGHKNLVLEPLYAIFQYVWSTRRTCTLIWWHALISGRPEPGLPQVLRVLIGQKTIAIATSFKQARAMDAPQKQTKDVGFLFFVCFSFLRLFSIHGRSLSCHYVSEVKLKKFKTQRALWQRRANVSAVFLIFCQQLSMLFFYFVKKKTTKKNQVILNVLVTVCA